MFKYELHFLPLVCLQYTLALIHTEHSSHDSQGHQCSLGRAPPAVFVSALQFQSGMPGGTAVFPWS